MTMNTHAETRPFPPPIVVVTGVSGSGKSTVGAALAAQLGWDFQEGDDLHPAANRDKLAHGIALDDDDRAPWLQALAAWIDRQQQSGRPGLLTCSALKRRYRDVLREGRCNVHFLHLRVSTATLAQRMRTRVGHFMPASLLASQLSTYEPLGIDEPAIEIDAEGDPVATVRAARKAIESVVMPDHGAGPAVPS